MEVPSQTVAILVDGDLLHPLVESGVFDGDPGRNRQGVDQSFVVAGELGPPLLVGEIEIAVDLVAHPDRHTEERGHRGVVRREAKALRVRAQARQPERLGVADEQAQYASPGGSSPDPAFFLRFEPTGEESRERGPVLVQNPESAVAGTGHRARLLNDVAKQGG